MESDAELRERLRVAERAAAAPYVDYPPTPWWYPAMLAVYAAALALVFGAARGQLTFFGELVAVAVLLLAVFLLGAWWRWDRNRRGTWPRVWRFSSAPPEIRPVMRRWFAGFVVVLAVAAALVVWVSVWLAAPVAAVITYLGVVWYERVFGRAAARVRERLG